MKKISFFGLVLAFIAMAIFIVSCSQPLFPHGSNYLPRDPGNEGGDIPGWDTDGSSPCGRMTVAEQLDWLRNNATADTRWNVWAWMEPPYESIHTIQNIHGVGGPETAITVFLRTYSGSNNRLRLLLGGIGNMTMLNVLNDNTLILENIVLQGRLNSNTPLVVVSAGTLKQRSGSEIDKPSNYTGLFHQGTVSVRDGATFIMSGDALITGSFTGVPDTGRNTGVVVSNNAVLEMKGEASITNHSRGVFLQQDSTLIMEDGTHISGHGLEGVRSTWSEIHMSDEAHISGNGDSRGHPGVYLSNSDLFMHDEAQIHSNNFGGGVFANNTLGVRPSIIRMYNEASIHSNINTTTDGGGGVTLNLSRLYMYDYSVTIRGNSTHTEGGGVRLYSNSTLTIHRGLIYGINEANYANENVCPLGGVPSPNGHALYIADIWNVRVYLGAAPVIYSTNPPYFRNETFGVQGGVPIDNG